MFIGGSCSITVAGEITSNSPKDVSNDRVCISINLRYKDSNGGYHSGYANCYFNKSYVAKVREYLTLNKPVLVIGELSSSTFTKTSSNNIDIQGYSLRLIGRPEHKSNYNKYNDTNNKYNFNDDKPVNNEFDNDIPF